VSLTLLLRCSNPAQTRDFYRTADADLTESHFSNTRLEKSVFAIVNMHRRSFCDARFSYASFVDVNLANASIADSNLTGMRINGILVTELIRAYRDRA
jgi:uncharacterized protein YjbI with pentapeptide repeats